MMRGTWERMEGLVGDLVSDGRRRRNKKKLPQRRWSGVYEAVSRCVNM